MKRTIVFLLALLLCLSLCACSTEDPTPTVSETEAPTEATEVPTETVSAESIAGTYKTALWFLDETITLNPNTSYTSTDGTKGTYSIYGARTVIIDPVYDSDPDRQYIFTGDSLLDTTGWVFDEDDEFGLAFSPDTNGFTTQTFQDCVIGGKMPGCKYSWIALILENDGSFELRLGDRYTTSLDIAETFDGTYAYADSVLTLTYEGQDYPLSVSKNGQINFLEFHKVA